MHEKNDPARPERVLRSLLYVPGSSPALFAKAARGAADGIILDLEDSVAPGEKAQARQNVVEALNGLDWGPKTLAVRVNGLDSELTYLDLVALAENCPRLDFVVLPMVGAAEDAAFAAHLLRQAETHARREAPIGLEVIIETPLALENLPAIAQSTPRLEAMSFGAGDYAAAMGMSNRGIGGIDPDYSLLESGGAGAPPRRHLGDKWHFAMARIANCCRAYGLRACDSAYADFADREGYRSACLRAKALGFSGKYAIHPAQVPLANEVFSPTEQEAAWAREILAALERSDQAGQGAVAVAGEMLDLASIRQARRVLQRVETIAARDRAGAKP